MKTATVAEVDTPLRQPKYHYHREKGLAHVHMPFWFLILLGVFVALLISTSAVLAYKLIKRVALENLRDSERLSLIQPITPKAAVKTPSAPATTPSPARITSYNMGLSSDSGLQQILDNYNAVTPPLGAVVLDITDNIYATVEPDQIRPAASLYKLFVAREIYDFRAQKKLTFDQTLTITQAAVDQDNSDSNLPVGTTVQISECLRRMIIISDNACGYLLGGLIGWNDANQTLYVRGYSQTSLGTEQLTSAGDVSLLLRRVAEGQMVDPDSSHNLEAILFEQQINSGIPALLPPGIVGHKTGALDGAVHDAGIVRTKNKVYVIVVMSGPWKDMDEANNSIAAFSLQVYNYIENFKPKAS